MFAVKLSLTEVTCSRILIKLLLSILAKLDAEMSPSLGACRRSKAGDCFGLRLASGEGASFRLWR